MERSVTESRRTPQSRRVLYSALGVLDIEVEGVEGRDGTESWFDNVKHFVSPRISAAKAIRGTYRDHGLDWDNCGRNAHYAGFAWQGP